MSNKKPHVFFCTDGIFPLTVGGMQRHSRLLAEALAATGKLKLTVIHPHGHEKIFNPALDITEAGLSAQKTTSQAGYLLNAYRYSRQVADVLSQDPHAVIYSQGMAVWHRIKEFSSRLIINPHGLEMYQVLTLKEKLVTFPFRIIHNYLFRNCSKVVSLGGKLTGILENKTGKKKNKVVVLPNAVNLPPPHQRTFNNPVIKCLFVGRFAFNKGIDVLAEAASELNREGLTNSFEYYFVGKGPLFESLSSRYQEKNFFYKGGAHDEQLTELYKSCDVFVLPTLFEGMPTVVLEAMGYGMPVIVTDTGATGELVDQDNGIIIEKRSTLSLKTALLRFKAMMPEERKRWSDNSIRKVKDNFTWEAVAKKHVDLFYEMSRYQ